MKLFINGRFLTQKVTGVQRYAIEIVKALDSIISDSDDIVLLVPPGKLVTELKLSRIGIKQIGRLKNILWEHISFPLYAMNRKSFTLNLCNVAPLISPGIVCIHDAKIKAKPEYFSKKFLMWYNLLFLNETKRAKKILTVSEFSKREIMKYYRVNENSIAVVPDAWQHYLSVNYSDNALDIYKLEKNEYFFSMCSLEPNKNFKWIAEVAKANKNYTFVVSGSINSKVFSDGLGFDCPENMKLLGYISDEEAKTLMRYCKAFLFPTYYEGFGIPPLEALTAGAECIVVSDTDVMHEIFEDSVVFINPEKYCLPELKYIDEEKRKQILNKYSWITSAERLKFTIENGGGVIDTSVELSFICYYFRPLNINYFGIILMNREIKQ